MIIHVNGQAREIAPHARLSEYSICQKPPRGAASRSL
jgi:hypothetical protein